MEIVSLMPTVCIVQKHVGKELVRFKVGRAYIKQRKVLLEPRAIPHQFQNPNPKIYNDQPLYDWWKARKATLPVGIHVNEFICKNNGNQVKTLPQFQAYYVFNMMGMGEQIRRLHPGNGICLVQELKVPGLGSNITADIDNFWRPYLQ